MGRSRAQESKRARRAARRRVLRADPRPRLRADPKPSGPALRDRLGELVRSPGARFVLRFVAGTAALLLLYAYPYPSGGFVSTCFERYLSGYAHAAGLLLRQFDPTVHVAGNRISGRFPLAIVRDCDAMEVNILFASAVVAFPAHVWERCAGVGVGLSLLVLANLARIVSLYFIGVAAPESFEVVHREVWPLVLILTALGLFLAWTRWERRLHHDDPSPVPA
jgi:exosortase/archaeosortase family protein